MRRFIVVSLTIACTLVWTAGAFATVEVNFISLLGGQGAQCPFMHPFAASPYDTVGTSQAAR